MSARRRTSTAGPAAPPVAPRTAPSPAAVLAVALVAALALTLVAVPASAQAQWADADTATIHPGVQMVTEGAQCTANFVFVGGGEVYIGYAAHCAGLGAATSTNGCQTASRPIGTPVEISGADHPGSLAYSSWATMQAVDERDGNACAGNDFALVRIDPRDHDKVNPTVPFWGGPEGVNTTGVSLGDRVFSYGNSGLRPVDSPLSRKEGYAVQTTAGGWLHTLYTSSPGIPGDSGSAFVDGQGRALGVLSTLAIAPLVASNNITDVNLALQYANTRGGMGVTLVDGTEPFDPGLGTILG